MFIVFDRDRASDSPLIERVWSCHSERAGLFHSIASPHCEIVFTRLQGRVVVTIRGPETRARQVPCPADGEWLAIRLKAGAYLRSLPAARLLDGADVNLPQVKRDAFWLDDAAWQVPGFDDAEAFVDKLKRAGVLVRDEVIAAALAGDEQALSTRSVQRRFSNVCGMTYNAVRQIERARYATTLLSRGAPISAAQYEAGFYDQAHLTRSLRRYTGVTPASIARGEEQLSFLYKK
jgi:AraC-like DNA-binding protein